VTVIKEEGVPHWRDPPARRVRIQIEWRYFDLEAQLYGDDIIPKNGAIAVPQSAGLGLEPRADVIRDYRLA
jgi:hypothetical protein